MEGARGGATSIRLSPLRIVGRFTVGDNQHVRGSSPLSPVIRAVLAIGRTACRPLARLFQELADFVALLLPYLKNRAGTTIILDLSVFSIVFPARHAGPRFICDFLD